MDAAVSLRMFLKSFPIIIIIGISSCSLFENEDLPSQTGIDYLHGTEKSGRLKKQLNYSGSKDETVNSDIEFIYKNNRLIEKIYTDYSWNQAYILQKDTFIYDNGKPTQMLHYFRSGAPTSPILLSETTSYYYPNENTRIEVTYKVNGSLDDSIVYIYDAALLIEERYYTDNGSWGSKIEYNAQGKPLRKTDLAGENPAIYYYDEYGALEKTVLFEGKEERTIVTYERETRRNNELVIRSYLLHLHLNWDEPILTSHKKFKEGKLIEHVKYHPTMIGSEWFCTRYEYY